jgi:hypothetical protein
VDVNAEQESLCAALTYRYLDDARRFPKLVEMGRCAPCQQGTMVLTVQTGMVRALLLGTVRKRSKVNHANLETLPDSAPKGRYDEES